MIKRILKFMILIAFFLLNATPLIEVQAASTSRDLILEMTRYQKGPNYNEEHGEAIINTMAAIDPVWVQLLSDQGVKIVLTDETMNQIEEFADIPPAPINDGRSPEEIPGAYSPSHRLLFVQLGGNIELESAKSTALHELGHAVDYMLNGHFTTVPFSQLGEIERLIEKEKQAIFPRDRAAHILTGENPYRDDVPAGKGYLDQPEEYFAAVFDEYYMGGTNKEELRVKAPETFQLLENLETRFIVTENIDYDGSTFSWTPYEEAAGYKFYKATHLRENATESDLYETLTEEVTSLTIPHEKEYPEDYFVQLAALDESGNEIYRTALGTTQRAQLDVTNLEHLIAEATGLQAEVEDPLEYLQYVIESGEMRLDDYYEDGPMYEKILSQSFIVRTELDIIEMMETFDPESETAGFGPDRIYEKEALSVTPAQNAIGIGLIVGVPLLIIIGIVLLIRCLVKKRKAKQN